MSCKKPNCDCLEQQAKKDGVDIWCVKGGYECLYGDNRANEAEKHNIDRESPPVTGGKKSVFCTLSDKELITEANQWIQRLIKSAGKDWMFSVQGDANSDVDLILSEVVERFESIITSPVTTDIEEAAKAEVGLEDIEHASQTDYSFIEGAKFGVEWQKQQMAVTGTAEEPLEAAAFRMFNERLGTDKDGAYFLGFKDGSEWQASTQSTTIERLTKALEEIAEFADSSIVVKRIAREALASIKK